jgi:hypothetical protein
MPNRPNPDRALARVIALQDAPLSIVHGFDFQARPFFHGRGNNSRNFLWGWATFFSLATRTIRWNGAQGALTMRGMAKERPRTSSSLSGDRQFAATRWSIVLAAGRRSSPDSRQALESLCQTYWYPLYAYVRRRVPHRGAIWPLPPSSVTRPPAIRSRSRLPPTTQPIGGLRCPDWTRGCRLSAFPPATPEY